MRRQIKWQPIILLLIIIILFGIIGKNDFNDKLEEAGHTIESVK